jgi:glycogen phosphorylase
VIGAGGAVEDLYPKTARDAVRRVNARIEVTIRGKSVPLRAWKVERFLSSNLYLLEPERQEDHWITQRLYGGGVEDRIAQEIVLGVGGVRLLQALDVPVDVFHFNEGHAVFAGLELLRAQRFGGATLAERIERLRPHIVFTTHTPVPAGNEVHDLPLLRKMDADLGFTDEELASLGGDPFSMTVAGLRLARLANGVAELHGHTARAMWRHVEGAAPIISITNGVHARTWQDARIRAALVPEKSREQQDAALWAAHQQMKTELIDEIARRTKVSLAPTRLLIGFARRAAAYKRADLILGDDGALHRLFERGVQIVYAGKAHPRDLAGKALVGKLVAAAKQHPQHVVFLESYDMRLGALLTRGTDIWLNNPRRPLEASGTSGMKAAMNGVPNLSILDGWWPEGCEHGVTGWKIGDPDPNDDAFNDLDAARVDHRDRERLYQVLDHEVLPAYADRARWVAFMRASIAMSQWRFSSDRMIEDYVEKVYGPAG